MYLFNNRKDDERIRRNILRALLYRSRFLSEYALFFIYCRISWSESMFGCP